MITINQPDPNEYYFYLGLGCDWNTGTEWPSHEAWIIAIPVRLGAGKRITFDDKECSLLQQGYSRSPSGMTEVTHLKVDGELELLVSPERVTRAREIIARHPHDSRDRASTEFGSESLFAPYCFGLPNDGMSLEQLACIGLQTWFCDSSSPTSSLQARRRIKVKIIGQSESGTYSYTCNRSWARDALTTEVRWSLDRQAGSIVVEVTSEYSGEYLMWDKSNVTPESARRTEYKNPRGKWHVTLTKVFSPAAKAFLRGSTGPQWTRDDFVINGVYLDEHLLKYYRYGSEGTWAVGYLSMGSMCFFGPGPDQLDYWEEEEIRGLLLPTLLDKFKQQEAYEIGSQELNRVSFAHKDYAFGNRKGRYRGGVTIYAELQQQAIEQNRYINTNLPMFFSDIAHAVEDWNSLSEQLRRDKKVLMNFFKHSRKRIAKEAANTYLPLKYGWYLTTLEALSLDLSDLWSDVRLASDSRYLGPTRAHERVNVSSYIEGVVGTQVFVWQAEVRPNPNSFSGLFAFLDERSMWLTASDAWDWIPYSFVVNWLTDLPSRAVSLADFHSWKANYDLREVCRSYKYDGSVSAMEVIDCPSGIFDPTSTLHATYYHRTWSRNFDPPLFYKDEGFDPDRLKGHWIEATALLVQRW